MNLPLVYFITIFVEFYANNGRKVGISDRRYEGRKPLSREQSKVILETMPSIYDPMIVVEIEDMALMCNGR
jgi:hypothetical protein